MLNARENHFLQQLEETRARQEKINADIATIRAREAQQRAATKKAAEKRAATVVNEPDIYTADAPHSWFVDRAVALGAYAQPHVRTAAMDRLERHGKHMQSEYRRGTKVGQYAGKVWRELGRNALDAADEFHATNEFRAMSSGSGSGGSLVTPLYLVSDYQVHREFPPAFAEQGCTPKPLPQYGMSVSVPVFTGSGSVNSPSENTTPTEVDPTGTYRQEAVTMFVGSEPISQQLLDRGGNELIGFDQALYAQLMQSLEADVDLAAINVALAAAQTVPTRASFTAAGLYSDLGHAASLLMTADGTKLAASGAFVTPTLGQWMTSQTATTGQPIFGTAPENADTSNGFLGRTPAGLSLWSDGSIPASGSNAQILVASSKATYLYAGTPIFDVIPQGYGAGSLTALARLRQYVAPVAIYPSGVAVVTGNAYPTSPTWS